MRQILCILTAPPDATAQVVISAQRTEPDATVQIIDLTAPEPDYDALLDAILQADSVQVW